MADTSGYEKQQQQEHLLNQALEQIMNMSAEEIHEKIKTMTSAIESLTPYITTMNKRVMDGNDLTLDELKTLEQMTIVMKKSVDFVLMAKQALMNKLMAVADSYYYSLKAEAENGNEEAQKIVDELRVYKQEAIRSEFPENNN